MKEKAKPLSLQPHPIPKAHKYMLNKEAQHLFLLRVLVKENDSEWGAPYFTQPKTKINWVRFLRNFRNSNKQLKLKLYPICKIN